jgi:hypothetical protein
MDVVIYISPNHYYIISVPVFCPYDDVICHQVAPDGKALLNIGMGVCAALNGMLQS